MPCYDERNSASSQVEASRKEWLHNSPIAELLCELMTKLAQQPRLYPESALYPKGSKLWYWWQDHQERDRKKAKEEERRKAQRATGRKNEIIRLEQALAKLKKG
jgi:hypothetical protein